MAHDQDLKRMYYDYQNPASLGTFARVKKQLKNSKVSDHDIQEFLLGQKNYSLFKKRQTKIPRRRIWFKAPFETLCIDLMDLSRLSRSNQSYKWIFVAKDLCSNALFLEAMKQKSFSCMKTAFTNLIAYAKSFGKTISKVWSDRGK